MKLLNCFRKVQEATAEKHRLDGPTRERIQREVMRVERLNKDIDPAAAHIAAVDEVLGGLMAQTEAEIERVMKAMEANPETRAEAQGRGEGQTASMPIPRAKEAMELLDLVPNDISNFVGNHNGLREALAFTGVPLARVEGKQFTITIIPSTSGSGKGIEVVESKAKQGFPVVTGRWMDQWEPYMQKKFGVSEKEYQSLPVEKRAEMEATQQLDEWLEGKKPNTFAESFARTYHPKEWEQWMNANRRPSKENPAFMEMPYWEPKTVKHWEERFFSNNSETGTQEPLGTESAPSDKPASPEPVGVAGSGFTRAIRTAADAIKLKLQANRAAMTWRELFDITDKAFGGTQAEGKYTVKDAYDAMELGVNLLISGKQEFRPQASADAAAIVVRNFEDNILPRIPTQTKRTAEQDAMQQFSTPPHLAYLANWVANVRQGDVVLEPSAGIGGIGVFAKNAGATVIANELSDRRRQYLAEMGFDHVTGENAENLHAIYEPRIAAGDIPRPTVVVMNPPFSNAAVSGKTGKTIIGAQHVEEGLKLLPEGGRLVAIVGEGMAMEAPTFRAWWAKIQRQYNVKANVWMNGRNYVKYGTSFDNRLLVIDKTGPTTGTPLNTKVDDLKELPYLLKGIRDERTEPTSAEQSGSRPTGAGGAASTGDSGPSTADDAGAATGTAGDGGKRRPGGKRIGSGATDAETNAGNTGAASGPAGVDGGNAGGRGATDSQRPDAGSGESLDVGTRTGEKQIEQENEDDVFANYTPSKVSIDGAKTHPAKLVESAAMASVPAPNPTYRPSLPKSVITEGKLSEAQLENVIYAGQAHEGMLENGERRGYFIGDGTGVGKGRQISGIILDNIRQGRKKAVWVSKSTGLIEDAKRDAADLGIDPQQIRPLRKLKKNQSIDGDGIMFTSYDTLKGSHEGILGKADEWVKSILGKEPKSRVQQLVNWLGADFDGVIVFDEAHMAGNAIPIKGKRGVKAASKNGVAVVDLQKALPKARVVYVSATGATEIENLSYADRLGIWGPGTPFGTKSDFFTKIGAGGISAMEIVSRDLKALGLYLARSISFKGVEFSRLTQQLTPEQTEIYNQIAEGWQVVLAQLDETMANSGANNSPKARSAALSAFWGAQQRFFNQIVTAMEMPALLADMRQQLDAGNSLVLQLVNTNEASQNREIAKRQTEKGDGEETDLEDLDLSPRDILLQYINNSYPTTKYIEVQDPNNPDATVWVPAKDSKGNLIQDPEAVRARDALNDRIALLRIPENPIEQVMNAFGADNVAEVTGRTQRVVQKLQKNGKMGPQIEKRNEHSRQAEAKDFQDGKRRVLIFSQAGGTGFSFHADRRAKNQQRRIHYLVQAGWRADAALQGFGRTHRTNQVHAPSYKLVETSIPGHKRFIATIARRLAQLGALTTGERKSAGQGMFTEADNLEGQYADDAIKRLIYDLFNNRADGLTMQDFASDFGFIRTKVNEKTGEKEIRNTLIEETGALNESKIPTVPIFLNRILSTPLDRQAQYFNLFTDRMMARIEKAKSDGTFDAGTQLYKAARIEKVSDEAVYKHPGTDATTRVVEVNAFNPVEFSDFDTVSRGAKVLKWVKNKRSGRIYALKEGLDKTDEDGRILPTYRRIGTRDATTVPRDSAETDGPIQNYEALSEEDARAAWDAEIAEAPKESMEKVTFLVGAMLPIFDRIQLPHMGIYRFTTSAGESMLGVKVPTKEVAGLRARLGAKNTMTPDAAHSLVLDDGGNLKLANGWRITRRYVSGENRVEVTGLDYAQAADFVKRLGGFMERVAFQPRYFIPSAQVMGAVMKISPITEVNGNAVSGDNTKGLFAPSPDGAVFYSQLTRAVEGLPQAVMTVQQARAAIEKGAKKDEVAMSGILTDPLSPMVGKHPNDKVTKAELLGFALERQATVEDVTLSEDGQHTPEVQKINDELNSIQTEIAATRSRAFGADAPWGEWRPIRDLDIWVKTIHNAGKGNDAAIRRINALPVPESLKNDLFELGRLYEKSHQLNEAFLSAREGKKTHFSQYQLPGADGGSYREMFVTWPEMKERPAPYTVRKSTPEDGTPLKFVAIDNATGARIGAGNTAADAAFYSDSHTAWKPSWSDGHSQYSEIKNPIVRIRRNMRTDAEGRRTYFIEEIQGPGKSEQEKMPAELRKRIYEIGMKRALRDAIDEGADAIGWTTGEQQIDRYEEALRQNIDRLEYEPYETEDGGREYELAGFKNGKEVFNKGGITPDRLEELVGKDLASKIERGEGVSLKDERPLRPDWMAIEGKGLSIGGQGLKRLYDATLPTIARDLAKKFGGVVGKAVINDKLKPYAVVEETGEVWGRYDTREEAVRVLADEVGEGGSIVYNASDKYNKAMATPATIHSMPIPAELSERVRMEGFALFAPSPVDVEQIEEEKKATLAELPDPTQGQRVSSSLVDALRRVVKGRKDRLDMAAPGAADVITDTDITGAKTKAAIREMLGRVMDDINSTFGNTKDAKGRLRRKEFMAELLPVAARLNATGRDAKGAYVFEDFNMRAGTLSKAQAEASGVQTGDVWAGRGNETLQIGEYLEDQKAFQLLRFMPANRQAGIYAAFEAKYPEMAHLLRRWIDPDLGDARVTDARGTVLPEFNRNALRKFFGEVSPQGELDDVAGYVPEISRTRSIAGMISQAFRNLLNKNWLSGAREYKSGEARERGQVQDLVTAFGIRAMEAHAELQRREQAEKLLAVAVQKVPVNGIVPDGWVRINPDNLGVLVNAYGSAHGMTPVQLAKFTKAIAAGDMKALKVMVGQAWARMNARHMISKDALGELVRPLTDRIVRNRAVQMFDSLSKAYVGGLLAHPFSWIGNMTSNELFKMMRIAQRTMYGGMMTLAGLKPGNTSQRRAGKLALREAWELSKGMLTARWWNQDQINDVVPPELFEGNTSIAGAVRSLTEDQMTSWDFLKRLNVPQAILKAAGYSNMDVRAKQQLAYASLVAQAEVAADEAVKRGFRFADKAQRVKWMRKWLNEAGPEVNRRAYNTAVAYAMDYENVPWWMDEKATSPEINIIRRLLFPFIKWPYNLARQMKRFGVDSALDVMAFVGGKIGEKAGNIPGAEELRAWRASRKVNGARLANSLAHLGTFGMMYAAMRALLSTADDEDQVTRLGRSFDQAGERLEREFDTSNRVNITDVPILGPAVAALAKMNGGALDREDYWLRVRNIPYSAPMLAMASSMAWLGASGDKAAGYRDEALNAWKEFVGDFYSEGIVLSAMNAIHGNESKYVQGQPVSATLGGMAVDLFGSRLAPVPVLSAIRDTVDPNMRRLSENQSLDYSPGFVEGVKSRIPGMSDDLPLKGTVRTRSLDNAVAKIGELGTEARTSSRVYPNEKGNPVASYVDPEDRRKIQGYRTALRLLGMNIKPINRDEYKLAVKGDGEIQAYRKVLRELTE